MSPTGPGRPLEAPGLPSRPLRGPHGPLRLPGAPGGAEPVRRSGPVGEWIRAGDRTQAIQGPGARPPDGAGREGSAAGRIVTTARDRNSKRDDATAPELFLLGSWAKQEEDVERARARSKARDRGKDSGAAPIRSVP